MDVAEDRRGAAAGVARRDRVRGDIKLILAIVAVLDMMAIVVAALAAWDLRVAFDVFLAPVGATNPLIGLATPWIILAWLASLALQRAYAPRTFGAGPEEFRNVILGSLLAAGVVAAACYLLHLPLSRGFVILTFFLGVPLLLAERYAVRKVVHRMRRDGRLLHRVIAVGGPTGVGEIAESLRREQYVGYQIVGVCVPPGITEDAEQFPAPVIGTVTETRHMCDVVGADTVLVARGGYATSHELRKLAWQLEGSDIDLIVVPSLTDVAGPRISMRPVAGLPLVHVDQPQAGEAGGLSKRLFDVVLAGGGLVLLSPLLLFVAVAIKRDRGPVLFRQTRIGRGGEPFGMLKFRSMVVDAEDRLGEVRQHNDVDGVLFKMKDDPRTTPIGRFLRRYSIDELPQLGNVLRGEMSLVGPRPPLPAEVEQYPVDVRRRLLVRPGLTGLWQVSGRSTLSWDETVRLDLYYVDNWSMTSDLVIIAKTVKAVLSKHGAY